MGIGFVAIVWAVLISPFAFAASIYLVNRRYPLFTKIGRSSVSAKACVLSAGLGCAITIGLPFSLAVAVCVAEYASHTHIAPPIADVVGDYHLDAASNSFASGKGYLSPNLASLSLRSDGTFRMEAMPDMWRDPFGMSKSSVDSGTGTWQMSSHEDYVTLDFMFDRLNSDTRTFITPFNLGGHSRPYSIWCYIGDPDGGSKLCFTTR